MTREPIKPVRSAYSFAFCMVVACLTAACSGLGGAKQIGPNGVGPIITAADYKRAEQRLQPAIDEALFVGEVKHHWIGSGKYFWYVKNIRGRRSYYVVNAANRRLLLKFDDAELVRIVAGRANGEEDFQVLTVIAVKVEENDILVDAAMADRHMRCRMASRVCIDIEKPADAATGELVSPDGKYSIFSKDHNLWLRSLPDGRITPLTHDGEKNFAYGVMAGSSGTVMARKTGVLAPPPVAIWSPDSTRVVTHKLDERNVAQSHLLQTVPKEGGAAKPVVHSYNFASPSESVFPAASLYVFDIEGGRVDIQLAPQEVGLFTPIMDDRIWWGDDSQHLYFVPRTIYQKQTKLMRINVNDGAYATLISESGDTYVDLSADGFGPVTAKVLTSGDIIWYSERDGWGHIYRYDKNGRLKNRITRGEWQVRKIVRVDEAAGRVFFTAGGREAERDPYYAHLYSIALDGSDIRLLTPEDAHHELELGATGYLSSLLPGAPGGAEAAFAPNGAYFIEQYSRPNLPAATVLRDLNGNVIMRLGEPASREPGAGKPSFPEPFEVLAADGVTKIYGNIFRPGNFDPTRKYPIVDFVHPGPYSIRTRKSFRGAMSDEARAMAELGFVTITLDARGTPYRSKRFHDYSYRHSGPVGAINDHIAAITQLAERYAYIDLDRVGVYGRSGGGATAARAILEFPEFFKVAVAASGAHNPRHSVLLVGTTYLGPYSEKLYEHASNAHYAENLKGKLFLIHGELDEIVHPAQTMHLANALVRANKSFDMLIIPNGGHSFGVEKRYVMRRKWDYFVNHLLGAAAPDFGTQ